MGDSIVKRFVLLPSVLTDILISNGVDDIKAESIIEDLLTAESPSLNDLNAILKHYNADGLDEKLQIKHLLMAKYNEVSSTSQNSDYISGLRSLYNYIIKAILVKIQTILDGDLDNVIYDASELLEIQNINSHDRQNGFIWVVNTAVTIVTDYNSNLIEIN